MRNNLINVALRAATLAALSAGMVACGGGGDGGDPPPPPPPATFSIGGNVTGLAGAGLVLRNNGANDLAVNAAGAFTFAARVNAGAAYAVTVGTQPAGQTCSVANGNGTASVQVNNVNVSCADVPLAFDASAAFQVDIPLPDGVLSNAEEVATATHPSDGTSLLVYTQRDADGILNVFSRVLAADGLRGQELIGQSTGGTAGAVRVKYGPNGKAIAIWRQARGSSPNETDILARVYDGGQWGLITRVAQTPDTQDIVEKVDTPDLAFDAAGNAVAVWSEQGNPSFNKLWSAAFADSTSNWAEPKQVFATLVTLDERETEPRVVLLQPTAKPEFLVVARRRGGESDGQLVAYRCAFEHTSNCAKAGIGSGAFLPMPQGASAGEAEAFNVGSNAAGDVVVAWRHKRDQSGREVNMTSRPSGSSAEWRPVQAVLPEGVQTTLSTLVKVPAVHVAASGAAVLAWSQSDSAVPANKGVFAKRFTPTVTGPMVPAATMTFDGALADSMSLTVTEAGSALVLWTRAGGPGEGMGLFSSTFDATAETLVPGPTAAVENAKADDLFPIALGRGADGKGVAVWIETKVVPQVGAEFKVMANRFK